jgi:hypothetical protein
VTKTELILAPGTSPQMKEIAEALPPYDLLKAYREARQHFGTPDIVLVVVARDTKDADGFQAFSRSAYIEQAFRRWTDTQKKIHPLARESAHKKMQLPRDGIAFWLVVEMPELDAVGCCAIGAFLHPAEMAAEN